MSGEPEFKKKATNAETLLEGYNSVEAWWAEHGLDHVSAAESRRRKYQQQRVIELEKLDNANREIWLRS